MPELRLKNHKIEGLPYRAARWINGPITPELVIVHDTAGSIEEGAAADYLRYNNARYKPSVHFVVDRSGAAEQQVPTNRGANHAGESTYHGRRYCNGFSLGIEISNPGFMDYAGNGKCRAWWDQLFDIEQYGLQQIDTPHHSAKGKWWMPHTAPQLSAVEAILVAVFAGIPTLKDIQPHWYVSPGRKNDTNPFFPLEQMRSRVLGREHPVDYEVEETSEPGTGGDMVRIVTAGSNLNHRRWPSLNPNVIGSIPNGEIVPVLRTGTFDGRKWHCVFFDGREGWVVASYTAAA